MSRRGARGSLHAHPAALPQYAQEYGVRLASRTLAFVRDHDRFASALDDEMFRVEAAELVAAYGGPADQVVQALYRTKPSADASA